MSGLLRRLTRRRAATADEPRPSAPETSEPDAAPAETPAEAGGAPPVDSSEQPTAMIPTTGDRAAAGATRAAPAEPAAGASQPGPVEPAAGATAPQPAPADAPAVGAETDTAPARDLPAGIEPGELGVAPAPSARRGKLRRRLRYLRRVRELLLRDLGGFTYELHRTAGGSPRESHRRLAEAKASRLAALDAEVRELEARLSEPHEEPVLREPGVGGTCPECGELHSSDAHYCFRCGEPLDAKARSAREAAIRAAAQPTTGAHPTPEPKPASVLWAAGPRPRAETRKKEPDEPAAQPRTSMATSEWLAVPGRPGESPAAASADEAAAPSAAAEPPAAGDEPAATAGEEPAAADETPPAADKATAGPEEPAVAAGDEPAAADKTPPAADQATAGPEEPAVSVGDEPAAADETPPAADESTAGPEEPAATAGDEPAAPDKSPPAADQATAGPDQPAAAADDEPAASAKDEPGASAEDEPAASAGDEPAASAEDEPAASAGDEPAAEEAGPNGRRDEDVPPPLRSGDPLGSPGERRP